MRITWRHTALALVFVWFFFGGIGHFVWLDAYTRVVPPWAPYPREVALLTGVCDVVGGLGILWSPTRRLAGWALIAYCLCVWPVHFEMLARADHYHQIAAPLLWARLIFQPILMVIIWAASQPKIRPTLSASTSP